MSKALRRLKEQMEIDFLKSKTYTEINEMFNQMKQKVDEAEGKLNELNIGGVSGSSLIEIENAYIEDADTVDNYDATGRVSKLWITKEDFDQIKCINN